MFHTVYLFWVEILRNFKTVGALAPSSPALARAMLRPLARRPNRPIRVMEAGPGTGAITVRLLRQLRPGDSLDLIELNPVFCRHLSKRLPLEEIERRGIRVRLHQLDVRDYQAPGGYDYIVSGLPFANFDSATVSGILSSYMANLAPEGVLSFFEYVLPHWLRLFFLTRQEHDRWKSVIRLIRSYQEKHQTGCSRIWLNLPPARARHLRKNNHVPPIAVHVVGETH